MDFRFSNRSFMSSTSVLWHSFGRVLRDPLNRMIVMRSMDSYRPKFRAAAKEVIAEFEAEN